MKYSVIFGQIQTFIRNATPKVLKANHATVEESLLKSVNMLPVNDSLLIQENITAIPNPNIFSGTVGLNLWLKRIGNEVVVSGSIINSTPSGLAPYRLASINLDSEFLPDDREDPVTELPYVFRFDAVNASGDIIRMCVRTVADVAYIETLTYFNPTGQHFYIKNGRYDAKD